VGTLPADEIDPTILRMRAAGEGWSAIGNVVGLSRDSVRRRHEKLTAETATFLPKPAEMRKWSKGDQSQTLQTLRDLIVGDIRAASSGRTEKPRMKWVPEADRFLLEIAPVDLHVGKLAWGEETGHDYDIRIAEQVFTDAIDEILHRASRDPLEQIVLVVGNDLLQTDNLAGTTTAGTYVDTDTRYIKAFRRAVAINRWAIQRCSGLAPVVVKIIPGNHDRLTAFHVGDVLAASFAHDPSVTVDNSPTLRKYHRYGPTLLGWTHGSEEKAADLPLIMAQEQAKAWSETEHREWHVGHLHKAKETRYTAGDSFNGVRVRILPSLCGPDAWHYQKGFVHERRACEAYLFSRSKGYAGHYSANAA
jgi:hypothetical protein